MGRPIGTANISKQIAIDRPSSHPTSRLAPRTSQALTFSHPSLGQATHPTAHRSLLALNTPCELKGGRSYFFGERKKTRMWHSRRCDSAMEIPGTLERPWTPPELEDRSYARPDHFDLYSNSPSRYSRAKEQRWLREANRVHEQPPWAAETFQPKTPTMPSRPKPTSRYTEPPSYPYTPTRSYYFDDAYPPPPKSVPRYPYTPDTSQILRRHTEFLASPTPWDDYSVVSSSPVQHALSSCIAQFEDLIQSQQPDEDQMEYIVGQFEAMATHLATPEPHTRDVDEQTVLNLDHTQDIMQTEGDKDGLAEAKRLYHQAYVAEVDNYVKGVQKAIHDLRKRLDEVKTLNSIQLDVINDLRMQMKNVRQNMRDELKRSGGEDEFKISKIVDLDEVPADAQGRKKEKEKDEYNGNDGNDNEHYDNEPTTKEFGMDSWQTLVDDENFSQEIHEEYAKFVRSTVDSLTAKNPPVTPTKRKLITIVRTPPRRSFWASIGEALDAMSDLLLED